MNVDILSNYFINIEETILLSRLKVVLTFILSQEEILFIRQETEIREMSDDILKLLELEKFMVGVKNIFRTRVPTFNNTLFR